MAFRIVQNTHHTPIFEKSELIKNQLIENEEKFEKPSGKIK
jgi:hypothetical protein